MTYLELTKHFGKELSDPDFQEFLKNISCDPATYDASESDYIKTADEKLEIGFRNDTARYEDDERTIFNQGNPVFAHFNLYPGSEKLVDPIAFDLGFSDNRKVVREKAGEPAKVVDFEDKFSNKHYMIDHFKSGDLAVSIDYQASDESIEFIQIRDNTQAKEHYKL